MTPESSGSDWRSQRSQLGEFYGEFLKDQSKLSKYGEDGVSSSNEGIFFGQKAPLKLTNSTVPVVSPEKPSREWTYNRTSSFSELTTNGDSSRSKMATTIFERSTSGTKGTLDNDVETDLARVHPNSAMNGHSHRKIFKLPNGDFGKRAHASHSPPRCDRHMNLFLQPGEEPHSEQSSRKDSREKRHRKLPKNFANLSSESPTVTSVPTFAVSPLPSIRFSSDPSANSPTSPSSRSYKVHSITIPQPPPISHFDLVDTETNFIDPVSSRPFTGIVTKVSRDKTATVKKFFSGELVTIPCRDLKKVTPRANDMVKVVGFNSKLLGKIGTLLSVTGDSGVVRFVTFNGNVDRNLAQVKLSILAKYAKSTGDHEPSTEKLTTTVSSSSADQSTSKPVWGSAVLKGGMSFPFAPIALPTPVPMFPFMGATSTALSVYNPFGILPSLSTPSANSSSSSARSPIETTRSNGPTHYKSPTNGMPLSFQICPGPSSSSNRSMFTDLFAKPIARGGASSDSGKSEGSHAPRQRSSGHQDVADILDRLLSHQRRYHGQKDDDSNLDVKASCVRVSLICPISQRRLKYPSRGYHCKHLQCFDAEAYILMNLHHKPKARVKQANGKSFVQPIHNKKWHCPICLKYVHESQLYIDKSLMKVLSELQESVNEVELSESGTWQPYQKVVTEVIDLTEDDD